ncbi:hypothetical protein [Microlunatus parietis]
MESERDGLRAQLDQTRRDMITNQPLTHRPETGGVQRLSNPADLFEYGDVDLGALFPEGRFDAEALAARLADLYRERPRLFERDRIAPVIKAEGKTPGPGRASATTWKDALDRAMQAAD